MIFKGACYMKTITKRDINFNHKIIGIDQISVLYSNLKELHNNTTLSVVVKQGKYETEYDNMDLETLKSLRPKLVKSILINSNDENLDFEGEFICTNSPFNSSHINYRVKDKVRTRNIDKGNFLTIEEIIDSFKKSCKTMIFSKAFDNGFFTGFINLFLLLCTLFFWVLLFSLLKIDTKEYSGVLSLLTIITYLPIFLYLLLSKKTILFVKSTKISWDYVLSFIMYHLIPILLTLIDIILIIISPKG